MFYGEHVIPKFKVDTFFLSSATEEFDSRCLEQCRFKIVGTSGVQEFLMTNLGYFYFLVQTLKREKVLRVFKLNTGQDDHAIMFLDDYFRQVCLHEFLDAYSEA